MKYSFEAEIKKTEEGYKIRIPFNMWEVCKERDVIEGQLELEKKSVFCSLDPLEKGKYELLLNGEQKPAGVEEGIFPMVLTVSNAVEPIGENSPYSKERPVRVVDRMQVILQKQDGLCGQACVAMLAGLSIEEVRAVTGWEEWQATMCRMIAALDYFGIGHSDTIVYTQGKRVELPKCCILMEKMGRYCHYLVEFDGRYYDPNLGELEEYDRNKIQGYLEVVCA